jgi:hypothetical protein
MPYNLHMANWTIIKPLGSIGIWKYLFMVFPTHSLLSIIMFQILICEGFAMVRVRMLWYRKRLKFARNYGSQQRAFEIFFLCCLRLYLDRKIAPYCCSVRTPMVERCKNIPWLGNQYCYHIKNTYSKKHICYQKTWCSNQKTKSLSMLWFPFWKYHMKRRMWHLLQNWTFFQ